MAEPDDLLVVESHPGEVRLLQEVVDAAIETTLEVAADAPEALEVVRRRDDPPDAILLDWNESPVDGEAVLEELADEYPEVTVAVMSSSKHQTEAIESTVSEADAYLTKPSDPEDYLEAIRQLA